MRTRVPALILAASLAVSCGSAPDSPGSPGPSAGTPGPGDGIGGPFVRLTWTSADPSLLARGVPEASILVSRRGTLLRSLASPEALELSVRITTDGERWVTVPGPLDAPMGTPLDGAADWLQAVESDVPGLPARTDVLASADGVTWTRRGTLPEGLASIESSAVLGDAIVACGARRGGNSQTPVCAASTDAGSTWRLLLELEELLGDGELVGVAAAARGFLVLMEGTQGEAATVRGATSADGLAWTIGPRQAGLADLSPEVAPRLDAVGGLFVLAAATSEPEAFVRSVWTSADGRAWTRVAIPRIVAWHGELFHAGPALVVLADDDALLEPAIPAFLATGDGRGWRADGMPPAFEGTDLASWSFIPVPGGITAVNTNVGLAVTGRPVATADPGQTPAPATPSPSAPPSGAPLTPTFAWSVGEPVAEGRALDVVAWGGGFIAVGSTADASGHERATAWSSTDGVAWTRAFEAPAAPGTRMTRVATDGEVLVAAGLEFVPRVHEALSPIAAFWRSADGRTWERNPPSFDLVIGLAPGEDAWSTGLNDLEAGGPGFVAVGATRDGGATVWTSPDGLAWGRTATLGQASINALAVQGPFHVATGGTGGPEPEGRAWTSGDGLTWTPAVAPPGEAGTLAWGGADPVFVAAGWGPSAWWSMDGSTWEAAPDQESLRRRINDEGIATVAGTERGFVAGGSTACPGALDPCAAVWESPDGMTWGRWQLPPAGLMPAAIAVGEDRVVMIGSAPWADVAGWVSWSGRP